MKSFFWLCGFYQRFVADNATVATPLTNLMGKKVVWKWGEDEERAFQALKVRLLQYPVLTVPNFKLSMILHTDASDVGVGATLSQKNEGGGAEVGGMSKSEVIISGEELSMHEKEMLALVETLEEWRHYLLVVAVLVYTDNSALS